jgi:branched-subunit amino acid ABC-type transport system permease component
LVTAFVFVVAVLYAGYAGIMVGLDSSLQPTMGSAFTIKAFAAMVLGGLGNVWGTVLGAYFLGLVENLSIGLEFGGYSLPAGYKDACAFVIILLVLLFRPHGLFGTTSRAV